MKPRIIYFVSSHGFGHAARACAVMAACREAMPGLGLAVFSAVPRWFFADSLGAPFAFHQVRVDLGLVQSNSLEEDLPATVRQLRRLLPFPASRLDQLAAEVSRGRPQLLIADVAPLGIAVAERCRVPSLLVENFTWDWIYRAYAAEHPELKPLADYLEGIFAAADYRIRTEPFCGPAGDLPTVPPVSRRPRTGRDAIRRRLGVPESAPLVLVTMGGIEWRYERLAEPPPTADGREPWLVVPGASREPRTRGRLVSLPHHGDFYHPDLVAASDAVVGKLGYSTLAEVYRAGLPFGYVARSRFPETPALEAWLVQNLPHRRIGREEFVAGSWPQVVGTLLRMPRREPAAADGAEAIARRVAGILSSRPPARRASRSGS